MNSIVIQRDYIRAGACDTSANELRKLAKSSIVAVRRRVGENEKTPSDAIQLLSRDPNPEVRIAVGLSRIAPADIVARLVHDEHDDVRFWLASAASIPQVFLKKLAKDSNPYVAARAMRTLERLGSPTGRLLSVFELLSDDHSQILSKLEELSEKSSMWASDVLSEKVSEVLGDIRLHLERRRTLCAHWFDEQSGLSEYLTNQCLVDQERIIDHTAWLLSHGLTEPALSDHLSELIEQFRNHREFIENELFVEIKEHASQEEIDAVNARLYQAA